MASRLNVETRLAGTLGRRDEIPNIELAEDIAGSGNKEAVADLVAVLDRGKTSQRSDAIKVLYEIGDRNPELIATHVPAFLKHMTSANNRLVWGSLSALAAICRAEPGKIERHLGGILTAANGGSVIAKDQAMSILMTLAADTSHAGKIVPMLIGRLASAALNQLPMYAERSLPVIPPEFRKSFSETLRQRLDEAMPQSKRKRIEAVLRKAAV